MQVTFGGTTAQQAHLSCCMQVVPRLDYGEMGRRATSGEKAPAFGGARGGKRPPAKCVFKPSKAWCTIWP